MATFSRDLSRGKFASVVPVLKHFFYELSHASTPFENPDRWICHGLTHGGFLTSQLLHTGNAKYHQI